MWLCDAYGLARINPGNGFKLSPSTGPSTTRGLAFKSLSVIALVIILSFLLVLPANVALTRVQASLLNDSEETIVPFDRSFGGKVVPEIVGGSGVVSIVDAWRTFDWSSRLRLLKAYGKVLVLQSLMSTLFGLTIFIELGLIIGFGNIKKLVPSDPSNGDNTNIAI